MKPTLTAILRRLVTESGATITELARQTGVAQPTLYEFIHCEVLWEAPESCVISRVEPCVVS